MRHIIEILVLSLLICGCMSKSEKNFENKKNLEDYENQLSSNHNLQNKEHQGHYYYPLIEGFKNNIFEFIPSGWSILDSISFDYNNDSLKDYVILIESIENVNYKKMWGDVEMEMTDKPRILFVLNGSENGFSLSCQANELILTSEQGGMMGDPYQGIIVSGNKICTSFWGGSRDKWNLSHCFIFKENKWFLNYVETSGGDAEITYQMNYDIETRKFNYEYLHEVYDENQDSTIVIKNERYSKVIKLKEEILMDSFRPWTLEIDSVRF